MGDITINIVEQAPAVEVYVTEVVQEVSISIVEELADNTGTGTGTGTGDGDLGGGTGDLGDIGTGEYIPPPIEIVGLG